MGKKKEEEISVVADEAEEIGISPIDPFSLAQMSIGILLFLVFSASYALNRFYSTQPLTDLVVVFLLTILVSVGWEVVQFIIVRKFGGRKETLINSISDVIFLAAGAGLSWLLWLLLVEITGSPSSNYYMIILIILGILLFIFFVSKEAVEDSEEK